MPTDLFCLIDDFCQLFIPQWEAQILEHKDKKRNRPGNMSVSEIMTIMISFHQSNHRNFKNYYKDIIEVTSLA